MSELSDIQFAFTDFMRSPAPNARTLEVDPQRLQVYRELIYTNMDSYLSKVFPVLRSLYANNNWHALMRDFICHHRATSPIYQEIPQEFIAYLTTYPHLPWPFVYELAHYEWAELALELAQDEPTWSTEYEQADLLDKHPTLSPLAWVLHYQYPVHTISTQHLPSRPQDTFLIIYRQLDYQIKFMQIDATTAYLLALIESEAGLTTREALQRITTDPDVFANGYAQLCDLQKQQIIL